MIKTQENAEVVPLTIEMAITLSILVAKVIDLLTAAATERRRL